MAMPAANPPLSPPELFRLAHAFAGGHPFQPGETAYVIFSRAAPLYRIQDVCRTRTEAEATLRESPDDWSNAELEARIIYEVALPSETPSSATFASEYATDPKTASKLTVAYHSQWTETGEGTLEEAAVAMATMSTAGEGTAPSLTLSDVTRMELMIHTASRTWRVRLPKRTDAIFITRGAIEGIVLPYYHTIFGPVHADARRRSLLGES